MKWLLCVLCLCAVVEAAEVESLIRELSMPEYDAAGGMTRRLRANTASGTVMEPKMAGGTIEFFDVKQPQAAPSVLKFEEATLYRVRREVVGEHQISYLAAKGTLSGEGFTYRLDDDHLELHSNVRLETPTGLVSAKRAQADFQKAGEGGGQGIRSALFTGGIVFTKAPDSDLIYERAEAETATYSGEDGTVILSSPVTTWRAGLRGEMSGELKIHVGKLSGVKP